MKYRNKRNGQIYEQTGEVDAKTKTVFIKNLETGKEQNVTISTIRRWYEAVEEEQEQTEPEQVEPETQEQMEPMETEQETQEPEQTEQEPEQKKRKRKETSPSVLALHQYVMDTCEKLGGVVYIPKTDIKFRGLKAGKHMFVKYHWSSKNVILQVRSTALGLDAPRHPANHTFNDKYTFSKDTPENRAEIYRIMETCYLYQVNKNKETEEKKKAKKK